MNGEAVLRATQMLRDRCTTALVRGSFRGFGARSRICAPVRLIGCHRMEVGTGVYLGSGCWLQALGEGIDGEPALHIGDSVSFSGYTVISAASSVVIRKSALIARGVYISDHSHERRRTDVPIQEQGIANISPVDIGEGAWIGENAVVLPGVRIGSGAVVGANSVVRTDVPDGLVVGGVPARPIGGRAQRQGGVRVDDEGRDAEWRPED